VTLCAAGICNRHHDQRIVVVCDQKVSFFGGSFAADNVALKVTECSKGWSVMFAGENSALVPLVDAVRADGQSASPATLREFARLCSRAYRAERKNIIETEVLAKYDISDYAEYMSTRNSDSKLFEAITREIERVEETWNLLFFGFDASGLPHIFVITEYGKIQFCDIEGFAAIGSGAWAAMVTLATFKYSQRMAWEEAAYCMLAAKFSAEEAADGVGQQTTIAILSEMKLETAVGIHPHTVDELREEWKGRPRMPPDQIEILKDGILNPSTLLKGLKK
jgi:hypothetical protein